MNEKHLQREGVKKLLQSDSGRKYLRGLQAERKLDLLQPSDPKFYRVYGDKIRREKARSEAKEKLARDEKEEFHVKQNYALIKEKGLVIGQSIIKQRKKEEDYGNHLSELGD